MGKVEGRRGVKYSIILFPIFLLHEHLLKKGKHKNLVSKILILSKITTLFCFSRGNVCSSSFYYCRLRKDRAETFLTEAMPSAGGRCKHSGERRIWSASSLSLSLYVHDHTLGTCHTSSAHHLHQEGEGRDVT